MFHSEYNNQNTNMSRLHSFTLLSRDRQHPAKSYYNKIKTGTHTIVRLAVCTAILAMTSCSTDSSRYRWKTSDEALEEYGAFLEQSRTASDTSMDGIARDIVAWQTLEDSVVAFVSRDTTIADNPHSDPMVIINRLHDYVRDEILNRANAQPRTLRDVYTLKRTTSRCLRDPVIVEAATTARPFFQSLDSVNIYNTDCKSIVRQYTTYLYNVEKRGIHDIPQLLTFMREEDRLFRSFVPHLHEMGGMSAGDITKSTENIYRKLFRSAATDSISQDDLILYMTMRANRRLLTNALGCVADIKAGKVKSADQLQAYMWMIMQPFISIDDLGMALLTERQTKEFETLAKDAPSAIRSIVNKAKLDKSETLAMPDLIVKIHISSL